MEMPLTTSERVYRELRRMVFTGELAPGEKLVQRKLAGRLGVSAIPILEATRRLERDGLVVSHANWGAQVQRWTVEDVEGAYLAREALEGICCRLFAQRANDVQKAELVDLGRLFDERVRGHDPEGWLETDLALHTHIVRSTGASTLVHVTESSCLITLTMRNAQRNLISSVALFPRAGVHDEMIGALLSGDAEAAERMGRSHIQRAYERLKTVAGEQSSASVSKGENQ